MTLSYQFYSLLWNQPWFRSKFGKTLYKRMCLEGDPPDAPFTKEFFGLNYEGNLQNTIDFSIYYYGAFEKPLLFFLRDCLHSLDRKPSTFFDIGANIGQHALFMSNIADQVHAFEPYPVVRNRLLHQIERNSLGNLTVHPLGFSDSNQCLPFFAPTGRNQGIGSFDATTISKGNKNIGELELVVADDYLEKAGVSGPSLIKIDVEGFEKAVLRGLKNTLATHQPVVVCEITYGKELSFQSMEELQGLFPKGYKFFNFDTRKADGRKARRRGALAKRSGAYQLVPFLFEHPVGQDDIVACPDELIAKLPLANLA